MCNAQPSPPRRPAFTLIELLVVMTLIVVIFALGLGYAVFGQSNQKAVTGAQTLTGWLLNAKQRARRDQVPTGVRILFTPDLNNAGNQIAFQLLLIQQPAPYQVGTYFTDASDPSGMTLDFTAPAGTNPGVDFQGAASYPGQVDTTTVQEGAPVQNGDYFTAGGSPPVHRVNTVVSATSLLLSSPAPITTSPGLPYTIIRGPRRLPSEDVLQMPPGVVIDFNLSQNLPQRTVTDSSNPSGIPYAEILFSPGGNVVGQGTGPDKILLWLRDPQPGPGASTPLILSVQSRTGFIGVFPVAPGAPGSSASYQFASDPRASGL